MGQEVEGMGFGERAICFTLFICLAVAVFTTVALIYLTSIVYLPVKSELEAGFMPEPVMCTSIQAGRVDCGEPWLSCYEWCISDPGGNCTQIWAEVRQNGTDANFFECSNIFSKTCLTLEDPPANKTWDCKDIDNYQCSNLEKVFQCDNGLCKNITSVYKCHYESVRSDSYDCRNRKNCIELTGLFSCDQGICHQILEPFDCKRVCDDLEIGGGDRGNDIADDVPQRNIVLVHGDTITSAHCKYGEYADMAQTVWDTDYTDTHMLVSSCTSVSPGNVTISTRDCINGSAIPWEQMPSVTNLTTLQHLMDTKGYQNKLDPTNTTFPFDIDILIIARSKLKVNHGGCVNTLREECKQWIADHSKDGRNYTTKARFPCYIMNNNTDFVVTRHDTAMIEELLIFMLFIPLAMWSASCCCVVFISCCIKIDDWGHFRFSIMSRVATKPCNAPQHPRSAWLDDKDIKHEDNEIEALLQDRSLKFFTDD